MRVREFSWGPFAALFDTRLVSGLVAVAVFATTSSCGFGGGGGGEGGPSQNFPERIRVINALVDETIAHVIFGEDFNIAADVPYGDTSPYLPVYEGKVPVRVRVDRSVVPNIDTTVTIKQGTDNTYLLVKSSSSSSSSGSTTSSSSATSASTSSSTSSSGTASTVTGTLLTDDTDTEVKSNFFRVKFLNAGPSAGMDVYITEPSVKLKDATPAFTAVAFGAATKSLDLEIGTFRVRLTEAGSLKTVYDSGDVTFTEGQILTFVLFQDRDGGRPYDATLLYDNG